VLLVNSITNTAKYLSVQPSCYKDAFYKIEFPLTVNDVSAKIFHICIVNLYVPGGVVSKETCIG